MAKNELYIERREAGRLCGKKTGFGKGQCNTSNPS